MQGYLAEVHKKFLHKPFLISNVILFYLLIFKYLSLAINKLQKNCFLSKMSKIRDVPTSIQTFVAYFERSIYKRYLKNKR